MCPNAVDYFKIRQKNTIIAQLKSTVLNTVKEGPWCNLVSSILIILN